MVLSTLLFAGLAIGAVVDDASFDDDDFREAFENELETDLGAPRDRVDDGFQKFATCANSGARQHCMAQMKISFGNSCADVAAEIQARANGDDGWKDPHNRGNYKVLSADTNMLKIKRRTGNNRYTDVITYSLSALGSTMCEVNSCSVSQGNSNNDAGTNMCNMMNLFCNKNTKNNQNGVACKPVKTDLTYTVPELECGRYTGGGRYLSHRCQTFAQTCLRQESAEASLEIAPVLGAPRDYRHDGFQLFNTCARSGARQHTMAQMTVTFANSCSTVSTELQARANGNDGWKDPHNRGNYDVLAAEGNLVKIKRRTGNNRYTDVITYSLTANGNGCSVNSCSVSQGNSNNDAGTNMCNMMDLFCDSKTKNPQNGVACKPVKTDLQYNVAYLECGRYRGDGRYRQHNCQQFAETCLRQESAEVEELEEEPVLGAPRDYRHDGFQLFNTCARSGARQHTMAQSTIEFANSCADVSAEMQARANGNDGWKDPHNRGNYGVLAAEGNLLKIKRRTGNNRYTDVVTMSLTANGSGCSVNACSVSQGNSNNDAGTNMCNMSNLYCNKNEKNNQNGVACKPVKTDLQYTVSYQECGRYRGDGRYRQHTCQNLAQTCLRQESELEEGQEGPFHVLKTLFN